MSIWPYLRSQVLSCFNHNYIKYVQQSHSYVKLSLSALPDLDHALKFVSYFSMFYFTNLSLLCNNDLCFTIRDKVINLWLLFWI